MLSCFAPCLDTYLKHTFVTDVFAYTREIPKQCLASYGFKMLGVLKPYIFCGEFKGQARFRAAIDNAVFWDKQVSKKRGGVAGYGDIISLPAFSPQTTDFVPV
jgi:hypothetical protein